MTDDFGFTPKRDNTLEKLARIKPSHDQSALPPLKAIDEAGSRAGFISREPGSRPPSRRRKEVGRTITINTRVPEEIAERFFQFCDQNRFSYWEGLAELMHLAKI